MTAPCPAATGLAPPKVPRPARAPLARSRDVVALWRELSALDDRDLPRGEHAVAVAELVEGFWRDHADSPVVERVPGAPGERIVTFLWRDAEAEEVLLFVNRVTDELRLPDSLMRRVPGTDVWHLSYRMRSDWRASYCVLPRSRGVPWPWADGDQLAIRRALDRGLPDPRNPRAIRNRAGRLQSVVELPGAPSQPWLAPREGVARGRVSERLGPDDRTVWLYEPADAPSAPLPVVVLLDGEVWTGPQDAATTLDNLIHDREIRPCAAVLAHSGGRERRWSELGAAGEGVDWIADRLLPWARARLPISADPAEVVLAGQSLGGLTALRAVLLRPEAVGSALAQSAALWQADLAGLLPGAALARARFWIEVGLQEWVLGEPNRRLAAALAAAGADVRLAEYNGGHDYACWRGGLAEGLRHLLPADL
ncbi:MAG: enterochelin esterase [Candidatus Nanopelagicales bacterium]